MATPSMDLLNLVNPSRLTLTCSVACGRARPRRPRWSNGLSPRRSAARIGS
jgi:hypothetical protein